jgi:hypothetical protein
MKRRGTFILIVTAIALYCSIASAQTTNVQGTATACVLHEYSLTGDGDIKDQASDSCKSGNASSSATSSLDISEIALASAQDAAGSTAEAEAFQTATLIPPKGFTGTSVQFSYADAYALKVLGTGEHTVGMAKVCIGFAPLGNRDCKEETNGISSGTFHGTFILKKSSSGFKLTIYKLAYSDAAGEAAPPVGTPTVTSGAVTTSNPRLTLPKGWKCKYNSGTPCP